MARVDLLQEAAKQIIKTASVIEREFSHVLIKQATDLAEADLIAGLTALKDAEHIYQRGGGEKAVYIFKHALTMEVVYNSLLTSQKQRLHRNVGEAIEVLHPDPTDQHSATLARHFSIACRFEKAADYAKAAAKKASRTGAYTDAIAHAKSRIDALEQLPANEANQKRIIDARTMLALSYMGINRHAEAKDAVAPIVELAIDLNYQKSLPRIFVALGHYYMVAQDAEKSEKYLKQAIDAAEKSGDVYSLWLGNYYLGTTFSQECLFEKATECYNTILRFSEMGKNLRGISFAKGSMSAFVLSFHGKIDAAYKLSQDAVVAGDQCGDAHAKGMAYASHGSICYFKGDFDRAIPFLSEAIGFCRKSGHLTYKAWAQFWLASTYFYSKRFKEAIQFFRQNIATMDRIDGLYQWKPYHEISLHRAIQAECGTIDSGFDPASCVRDNVFKLSEGAVKSVFADMLMKSDSGSIPEAEALIKAAIEANKRNKTKWYLGQDYLVYADLCQRKGDASAARKNLNLAIDIFSECGADGWVGMINNQMI